jgi:CDP-diacylglycerol--glycerol-3-phosphate 3-phosphatidyltransferase
MVISHDFAGRKNRNQSEATRWWTVSNFLSFSRIILLVPILLFLHENTLAGNFKAVGFMLLAAATDWFDGYFARRFRQKSDLGRIIDPLSDKICVGAVAIYLTVYRDFPLWFLILILARDFSILVLGFFITLRRGVPESNWYGKVAVTALAIVLITFTLDIRPLKWPFFWIMVGLFFISVVAYVSRFIREANFSLFKVDSLQKSKDFSNG